MLALKVTSFLLTVAVITTSFAAPASKAPDSKATDSKAPALTNRCLNPVEWTLKQVAKVIDVILTAISIIVGLFEPRKIPRPLNYAPNQNIDITRQLPESRMIPIKDVDKQDLDLERGIKLVPPGSKTEPESFDQANEPSNLNNLDVLNDPVEADEGVEKLSQGTDDVDKMVQDLNGETPQLINKESEVKDLNEDVTQSSKDEDVNDKDNKENVGKEEATIDSDKGIKEEERHIEENVDQKEEAVKDPNEGVLQMKGGEDANEGVDKGEVKSEDPNERVKELDKENQPNVEDAEVASGGVSIEKRGFSGKKLSDMLENIKHAIHHGHSLTPSQLKGIDI